MTPGRVTAPPSLPPTSPSRRHPQSTPKACPLTPNLLAAAVCRARFSETPIKSWATGLSSHISCVSGQCRGQKYIKLSTYSLLRTARHIVLARAPVTRVPLTRAPCQPLSEPVKPHSTSGNRGSSFLVPRCDTWPAPTRMAHVFRVAADDKVLLGSCGSTSFALLMRACMQSIRH